MLSRSVAPVISLAGEDIPLTYLTGIPQTKEK